MHRMCMWRGTSRRNDEIRATPGLNNGRRKSGKGLYRNTSPATHREGVTGALIGMAVLGDRVEVGQAETYVIR